MLFKVARRPGLSRALLQPMRSAFLRHSRLGFGGLVTRDLDAAESRPWVEPYLSDAGVRRDVTAFARGWTGKELSDASAWLSRFDRPVLLCWAPKDPYFKLSLATRLAETFPNAKLVEFPGTSTFVSLDQPERLADGDPRLAGGQRRIGSPPCRSTP